MTNPDASILLPHFQDEDKAREYLEALRWPDGVVCPHCGVVGEAYRIVRKEKTAEQIEQMRQAKKRVRKTQKGIWKCASCKKQFTVTVKTIFEDSHIPLQKWLLAIHFMSASKKGISTHQLMRMLGIGQYKSAWFMAHRIRYAMTGELPEKMSGVVEADETYIGGKRRFKIPHTDNASERPKDRLGPVADKQAVFSMVQRGGKVHSRHIEKVTAKTLKGVVKEVCAADAHLLTDTGVLRNYKGHKHTLVNHSADEYVRYEKGFCATTNTIESYFAILKRGINGVYHHVGRNHLHRYLGEFDFRYNRREMHAGDRAKEALKGFEGKRLTYKGPYAKTRK